jgi:hypothetical protein
LEDVCNFRSRNPVSCYSAPSGAATTATTSGAPVAADEVAPGPLVEARKMLWQRINQAKSEGIGTGAYVNAFQAMEEDVKGGKTEDQLRPRIESLARSLKDQLDRSKILKTQRPVPPTASQQAGGGASGGPAAGGGGASGLSAALGGKDPNALLDKLREKLNSGDIPAGLKEKVLNSEKGRQLLEKLSK